MVTLFGDPDSEAEDGYLDEQSDPEDQSDSRIREKAWEIVRSRH